MQNCMPTSDGVVETRQTVLDMQVPLYTVGWKIDGTVLRGVKPQRMKYFNVPTAAQTGIDAIEQDPLQVYMRDTPDFKDSRFYRVVQKAASCTMWSDSVRRKQAWTVNDGEAAVNCVPAESDPSKPRKRPIDKLLDQISKRITQLERSMQTKEQRERFKEFVEKYNKAIDESFGERGKDMLILSGLCTRPEKQGMGYGSALVRIVTSKADAQCRAVWLASSNIANTGFYNSFGFVTVAEIILGQDNPTWNRPPVVVRMMMREPEGLASYEKKTFLPL